MPVLDLLWAALFFFVMSIVRMVTYTAEGLLMMGGSLILIALGILAFMLTAVIFKRFIPWVIRGIAGLFRRIFRRGGRFHEKSTKIWLIAALILALAGGGLCVAALSIGVNFPEVRQNIMDGTYNLFGRNIFGWDDDVADVDEPEDILYGALSADGSVTVPVADKKEMEALYVDMDFGKLIVKGTRMTVRKSGWMQEQTVNISSGLLKMMKSS